MEKSGVMRFGSVTVTEMEEKSKKFSLIIELVAAETGVLSREFWYTYFPPAIVIQSFDDEDDLLKYRKSSDIERHRKGILKFFTSYFKEGDEGSDGNKSD